ncbi:beta-N-acetylglucosaminidase domain-containing protein [Lacticaseibacillus daqingensis]|uniref:beta-N-acetylglucosaminidase domain-containing protein n=1 Tax=Lacticaseibacillus daqingensis TaxID=2486014 RepID=UPI000F77EC00|nr:beta-N-acetylglucosaminidase domain-containing protein [Lacticaseibacillus daqingensis]
MQEQKRHYKMYKAGRQWVVAGIATLGAVTLFTAGAPAVVYADTGAVTAGDVTSTAAVDQTAPATDAAARDSATSQPVTTAASVTPANTSAETASQPVGNDATAAIEPVAAAPQTPASSAATTAAVAVTSAVNPADPAVDAAPDGAVATAAAAAAQTPPVKAATTSTVTIGAQVDAATADLANQAVAAVQANAATFDQIFIGTAADTAVSDAVAALHGAAVTTLNDEGYLIKAGMLGDQSVLTIQGKDATGLFYALNQVIASAEAKTDLSTVADYESPEMRVRGVIEGFYGTPWTDQARKDLFDFMAAHRMNTYIYSAKDDSYLRDDWKALYPADKLAEIQDLVTAAKNDHIAFVFALSPGNDITYSSAADLATTIAKFDQLRAVGVTQFYIALDDIPTTMTAADASHFSSLAAAQADYLNRLEKTYIEANGLPALWMVPTEYTGTKTSTYKTALGNALDPNIRVQWTGTGTFSDKITADSVDQAATAYNTDHLLIWDNFPVNDGNANRLYLNPVNGRAADLYQVTDGFTANPMSQPYASWIGVGSFGDYMWNASGYDGQASMTATVETLAGPDATTQDALRAFVDLNQNWEPGTGQAKAPILTGLVDALNQATYGTEAYTQAFTALKTHLTTLLNLPTSLQQLAVPGFYTDALPWLTAASQWAQVELDALQVVELSHDLRTAPATMAALMQKIVSDTATARAPVLPDLKGKGGDAKIPSIGDGEFQAEVTMANTALDNWLALRAFANGTAQLSGSATTDMKQYAANAPENMSDGDINTKFWANTTGHSGQSVVYQLDEPGEVQQIFIRQGKDDTQTSDGLLTGATIAVGTKADGSDKVAVGQVTATANFHLTLDKPVFGQYVFITLKGTTTGWPQVREVTVDMGAGIPVTNLTGVDGQSADTVFDGKTATTFTGTLTDATQSGTITNTPLTPVTDAKSVAFVGAVKGTLQVQLDGTWTTVGTTTGAQEILRVAVPEGAITGLRLVVDPTTTSFSVAELGLSTTDLAALATTTQPQADDDDPAQAQGGQQATAAHEAGAAATATPLAASGPAKAKAKTSGQATLPQTGEATSPQVALLGALVAVLSLMGVTVKSRRH